MQKIKQFESVIIKPGTYPSLVQKEITIKKQIFGAVVEIYGDQDVFEVDIGSSPKDWDTITVSREKILKDNMEIKEYDRVLGDGPDTWDNIFIERD